jgi:hypothetical protein
MTVSVGMLALVMLLIALVALVEDASLRFHNGPEEIAACYQMACRVRA